MIVEELKPCSIGHVGRIFYWNLKQENDETVIDI